MVLLEGALVAADGFEPSTYGLDYETVAQRGELRVLASAFQVRRCCHVCADGAS